MEEADRKACLVVGNFKQFRTWAYKALYLDNVVSLKHAMDQIHKELATLLNCTVIRRTRVAVFYYVHHTCITSGLERPPTPRLASPQYTSCTHWTDFIHSVQCASGFAVMRQESNSTMLYRFCLANTAITAVANLDSELSRSRALRQKWHTWEETWRVYFNEEAIHIVQGLMKANV